MEEKQTLTLCSHQVPVKFGCTRCQFEKIDEAIESIVGKVNGLIKLVHHHEEYLQEINKVALIDPDKVSQNMKIFNDRLKKIEKCLLEISKI